jgi:hypothetical protein
MIFSFPKFFDVDGIVLFIFLLLLLLAAGDAFPGSFQSPFSMKAG